MLVTIYTRTDTRSKVLGAAMQKGIRLAGDDAVLTPTPHYQGPVGDVALFYAYKGECRKIMADYIEAGKHVVYMDRGYFGEKRPGTDHYNGFHRFAIDALHPTPEQVMLEGCRNDRWRRHRITVNPSRTDGDYILVAGMSPNQARNAGLQPLEWELETVKRLRFETDRAIFYRPKPSWEDAPYVPGTLDVRDNTLRDLLPSAYLTVSHHSNVAIDGLIAGVPGVVSEGPSRKVCPFTVDLKNPYFPEKKELTQFLCGLSYWQWNRDEMSNGLAWNFLRERL